MPAGKESATPEKESDKHIFLELLQTKMSVVFSSVHVFVTLIINAYLMYNIAFLFINETIRFVRLRLLVDWSAK